MPKRKFDKDYIPFMEMYSTWTINLNINCKPVKFLGKKNIENLYDLGFGDEFLYTTPRV